MTHLGNNETDAPWCGDHPGTWSWHCGTSVGEIVLAYVNRKATCGACLDAHPKGREVLEVLARGAELEARVKERVDAVARRAMVPTPETVSLDAVWAAAYAAHFIAYPDATTESDVRAASAAVGALLTEHPRGGQ